MDGKSSDEEPPPGLYDCSPIQDGKRERKKIERLSFAGGAEKEKRFEICEGKGVPLGDIPIIEHMIYRANSDSLKPLHHLLFKTFGQSAHIKKNIRKFNGFAFEADAEECAKKTDKLSKMTMPELKEFCGWLSLEKSGSKEEVVKRILVFLLRPVDEGKKVPQSKSKRGRKRKSGSKDKKSKKKLKKAKESSASKEDDVVDSSDDDDQDDDDDDNDDDNGSESESEAKGEQNGSASADSGSSSSEGEKENAEEEKKKKKVKKTVEKPKKKKAEEKPKKPAKKKTTKKATTNGAAKKTAAEATVDDADISSDSDDSDDEPLATKKKSFPTDAQLESTVKALLKDADLDAVTMKVVLKDVQAKYPDVDLSSKKDFLKSTVKEIIS